MKKRFTEEQIMGFLRRRKQGYRSKSCAGDPHRQWQGDLRPGDAELGAFRCREAVPDRAGNPNQNAYIESFNGRLRDKCLNRHGFVSLAHAKVVIEAWRREYNEERPKKSLGDMTPSAYARQLAHNRLH